MSYANNVHPLQYMMPTVNESNVFVTPMDNRLEVRLCHEPFGLQSTRSIGREHALEDTIEEADSEQPPSKKRRGQFHCKMCDKSFTERRSLLRHERQTKNHRITPSRNDVIGHHCEQCGKVFARKHDVRRHADEIHGLQRREQAIRSEMTGVANLLPAAPLQLIQHNIHSLSPFEYPAPEAGIPSILSTRSFLALESEEVEDLQIETIHSDEPALGIQAWRSFALNNTPPLPSIEEFDILTPTYSDLRAHSIDIARPGLLDTIIEDISSSPEEIRFSNRRSTEPCIPTTSSIRLAESVSSDPIGEWLATAFESLYMSDRLETKLSVGAYNSAKPAVLERCPFCHLSYAHGPDFLACLRKHLDSTLRTHICEQCQFGFVQEHHLKHHQQSAKTKNHCGFDFQHDCSGHHPKSLDSKAVESLHEHMDVYYLTQLYIRAQRRMERLHRNGSNHAGKARWSVGMPKRATSLKSLTSSLNSRWTSPTPNLKSGKMSKPPVFESIEGQILLGLIPPVPAIKSAYHVDEQVKVSWRARLKDITSNNGKAPTMEEFLLGLDGAKAMKKNSEAAAPEEQIKH